MLIFILFQDYSNHSWECYLYLYLYSLQYCTLFYSIFVQTGLISFSYYSSGGKGDGVIFSSLCTMYENGNILNTSSFIIFYVLWVNFLLNFGSYNFLEFLELLQFCNLMIFEIFSYIFGTFLFSNNFEKFNFWQFLLVLAIFGYIFGIFGKFFVTFLGTFCFIFKFLEVRLIYLLQIFIILKNIIENMFEFIIFCFLLY